MSQLRITCDFKSKTMRTLDFPVEVRKPNQALVARSVISKPIEVPPGIYYVTIKLPGGQELFEEVKVGKRAQTVVLTPDSQDDSPTASQELLYFFDKSSQFSVQPNQSETLNSQQPPITKVRGFTGNLLQENCESISTDTWLLRSSGSDGVAQLNARGDNTLQLLQLLQPGQPAQNVVLPISRQNGCTVYFKQLAEDFTDISIHLNHSMANLLLRYSHHGYIQEAMTTASSDTLQHENLLANDPIAAAVRAYTLLRFGQLEELSNWTETLKNQFTWLPDSIAIRGETLARLGEHKHALTVFLELPSRGVPIFNNGLSYIIDRLKFYLSVGEGHFETSQLSQARALLEKLYRFAVFVDFSKPLLTFTGINPLVPDCACLNQEEIEATEGLELAEYLDSSISLEQEFGAISNLMLILEVIEGGVNLVAQAASLMNAQKEAEQISLIQYPQINLETISDQKREIIDSLELIYQKKSENQHLDNFKEKIINHLNSILENSDSNDNLDSFTQTIHQLEQLISSLERNIEQLSLENEESELQNYKSQLQLEIARLKKIEERLESIRLALDWLDPNTKVEFLASLVKEASQIALDAHPGLINLETFEGLKNRAMFWYDLRDFLYLIHGCLLLGKPDLIDYIMEQQKLPRQNSPFSRNTIPYVSALNYISNRVEQDISGLPAAEIKKYLDYLIAKLSIQEN
jgi:hypothetical protein